MDGNQIHSPTSRFNRLKNWLSNLSKRVKIGSILGSLAAICTIYYFVGDIVKSPEDPKRPTLSPSATLHKPHRATYITRSEYLQDIGEATNKYSSKQLQALGVQVSADADIEGLEGQRLTLEYSVYDNSSGELVPKRSNKKVYTIVPSSSDDQRTVTAFIPYPQEAGQYYASLTLQRQNGVELDELRMPALSYTAYFAGPQPPEDPVMVLEGLYDTDNTSPYCSDCTTQTDNTGALLIYTPSGWRDVDGRGWSSISESGIMGPGLSVSPNIADLRKTWNVPGVQSFATRDKATLWDYLDQIWNPSWNFDDSCQFEDRHNYNYRHYKRHYDVWKNCGGRGPAIVNLVAWQTDPAVWPDDSLDPPYMIFISVQLTGKTDIEAANAVFDSFHVNMDLLSQSAAPDTTGPTTATDNVGSSSQERTSIEGPSTADLEAEAEEAVRIYYRAAGSREWEYTYKYLDSETQNMFTEEEWKNKNQCLADINSVTYQILSVDVESSSQEPVAEVTLRLTFEKGSPKTRSTLFALEDGVWKHRFTEEEINTFKPKTSSEEFVADNKC